MRRAALVTLAAIACSAPPAPPPPPESRSPPIEAAASCPPVVRFAHDVFYFADLQSAVSCKVFLEQDECVLAILDDCTDDSGAEQTRQWEGKITALGEGRNEVRLRPIYPTPTNTTPPSFCAGILEGEKTPRPRAALACEGPRVFHQGLFLEKVDPAARPFAAIDDARRFVLGPTPPNATEEYAPDMAVVAARGKHELWVTLRSIAEEGGVYVRNLDSGSTEHVRIAEAAQVEVSKDGLRAVIGSKRALHVVDGATHMEVRSATVGGEINAMAMSDDAERVYVSWQEGGIIGRTTVEVRSARTLAPLAPAMRLPDIEVTLLLGLPTSSAGPDLFVATKGLSRVLGRTFTRDLAPMAEGELPFRPYTGLVLPGTPARIGTVSRFRNAYTEIDVKTVRADALTAVPYGEDLHGIAYDAARDRIYWSSRRPYLVGFIERRDRRASQDFARTVRFFGRLGYDPATGTLLALATTEGFVVPITP